MPLQDALLEVLAELVKRLLPGSVLFLLFGVTLGVVLLLLGEGRRSGGRAWLTILAVGYWLLSLPLIAGGLEGALGGDYGPLESAAEARGAHVVVVLTGGGVTLRRGAATADIPSQATAYRMLEAERLYHLLDDPLLLISGGPAGGTEEGNPESQAVKEVLVARGIPEARIRVEPDSGSTREQAVRIREWAEQENVESFVLVTSGPHMRRALGAFQAEGLHPIPSAAEAGPAGEGLEVASLLPSADALSRSEQAIREILALLYYTARGWLA
jgi:uncharacterized SAM-binding protein YcdF (DUF218 family)